MDGALRKFDVVGEKEAVATDLILAHIHFCRFLHVGMAVLKDNFGIAHSEAVFAINATAEDEEAS